MKEYRKITADMQKGNIASVYLFAGEETYLIRQLLDKLEQALFGDGNHEGNCEVYDGETAQLGAVVETANLMPMFGSKRLVVVKDAPWFGSKAGNDEGVLLEYLNHPSPYTCLVFLAQSKIDKRRKICKELARAGIVWESSPLEGPELASFVKEWLGAKGKTIENRALEPLLGCYAGGLDLLVRELEKLVLYVGERKKITLEDLEEVIVFPEQNNIFALTDAVGTRDGSLAIRLLRKMLNAGEQPVYILSMLARQLRLALYGGALAAEGYSSRQIAGKMQVHPYPVKKALAQARYFSQEELIAAMSKLLDADVAIKRGQGDPKALLEQTIIELCAKK